MPIRTRKAPICLFHFLDKWCENTGRLFQKLAYCYTAFPPNYLPHLTVYRVKSKAMKNFILPLFLATLGFACCDKSDDLPSGNTMLIGIDGRKCASPFCTGWFLEIDGDTLRFLEIPTDTDIDFNSELAFPIPVEVEWTEYDNWWGDIEGLIKVEKIYLKK